jgi:hypothetical protein
LRADVLQRVSTLPLSALTLQAEYHFELEATAGLVNAPFPISMHLDNVWRTRNFDTVTQIPSLTSLSMKADFRSIEDAMALGSHASLKAFQGGQIRAEHLLAVLANPRLETLSLDWISTETDEVKTALTSHPSITSLQLIDIGTAELLRAILRNPIIRTLTLSPYSIHPSMMHHISEMPSLRAFTLVAGDAHAPEVNAQTVRALCTTPLDTLNFEGARMNAASLAIAASAHARSLVLRDNAGTFDKEAITAMVANAHVTSLSFIGKIIPGGAAQLAAAPGLKKLSIDIESSEETAESVTRAWVNAGKALVDLTVK